MSEDIVKNNPKKETLFALGGVALFLSIVLLIGISGYLRPAGEHITAETTEAAVETEEATTPTTTDEAAPAETADALTTGTPATATTENPADATVTPTVDTDGAVVAAESGTATAEGTVNQAAVADDADLTAEQADADADAGKTERATPEAAE
ncbi:MULTISPECIES: hypothetical protein [unclassified Psychrobacter]|uniref:hypothetical protein n=1 Tax=unclassified Psychrobacter TaxID=196806 RepID=UPI0025E0B6F9|nr:MULTISPECIES: hypothetical protein [unclassified Psychrobacter]